MVPIDRLSTPINIVQNKQFLSVQDTPFARGSGSCSSRHPRIGKVNTSPISEKICDISTPLFRTNLYLKVPLSELQQDEDTANASSDRFSKCNSRIIAKHFKKPW